MTLFPSFPVSPSGSVILLSIKPRFANLIVTGSKRVELRRVVPALPVGTIVIYSSSPVQAIVGLAVVSETIAATPSRLWEIARDNGGGLTRAELRTYFQSKKSGFALMLGSVRIFKNPIDPKRIFSAFTPPQSFRYLTEKEINAILKMS